MRYALIPLLLACLTLTGCFPRLANYDGEAPQQAATPADNGTPLLPGQASLPTDRIYSFILLNNPMLPPETAHLEADCIVRYSAESGVPTSLLVSLIAVESSFDPRSVSPVGAQGLGQLMPLTARDLGVSDPFDVEQNIRGTARYIAWLGKTWAGNPRQWELALASYLAGVGTVSKQVQAGQDLTHEQSDYARKILRLSEKV